MDDTEAGFNEPLAMLNASDLLVGAVQDDYIKEKMFPWHGTYDTWRVTHDTCQVGKVEHSPKNFSILALMVLELLVICNTWHVTPDIWHLTYHMWHMTPDMSHVTHGGGWKFSEHFRFLAFTVWKKNRAVLLHYFSKAPAPSLNFLAQHRTKFVQS